MIVRPLKRAMRLCTLFLLSCVMCVACAASHPPDDDKPADALSGIDNEMIVGNAPWAEHIVQGILGYDADLLAPHHGADSGAEKPVSNVVTSHQKVILGPGSVAHQTAAQAEPVPFMLHAKGPIKKDIVGEGQKKPNNKEKKHHQPKIAILIDDLGYNHQGMDAALQLPTQVTLAILPMTPFAHQTAVRSKKQQRLTMLHAPMENVRELKLGPGGLYAKMSEKELKAALRKDLDSLPGVKGVNNHMGSLLTANQQSMDWVMQVLKQRHLFFIDSLTSSRSVAGATAKRYGLSTTTRNVFLDNIRTEKAIDHQFSRLLTIARKKGQALAIGHPYPETMAYLKKRLNTLGADKVTLVSLADLLTPRFVSSSAGVSKATTHSSKEAAEMAPSKEKMRSDKTPASQAKRTEQTSQQ